MRNLLSELPNSPMTPQEENTFAECIQRFKGGKRREAAIEALVTRSLREALLYAGRVCRRQLQDDEILSVCYPALVSAAKHFEPRRSRFFAFAKPHVRGAIARHWKSLDVVRGTSTEAPAERASEIPSAGDESECPVEPSVDPAWGKIFMDERLAQIEPAMSLLTKRERQVLKLVYQDGRTFAEIGEKFGSTRSAAWSAHERALKKIRLHLYRKKQLFTDK